MTPDGKILDISSSFAGGRFQYYPYSGSGNYTVNVQLSGKDFSGKEFTRFFSSSDFIGETGKFFTGTADYAIGSFLQTALGKNNGNYEGMACKVFRQGPSGLMQVGKGTVTWVGPDKCHVEILEFLNGAWEANIGDVIQLDPVMWKGDK